jgi:erythromycin esterase
MLNRRALLLGASALVGAAAIAGAALAIRAKWYTHPNAAVINWLKANALPLASAEPGTSFEDLEPLRPLIGDARIVSLGEATHGTREFFQLKHRMIEYCVSQLGFTMIGFEAEHGATLAVNDYVLDGKGNAVDVVGGMGFWTWDTEEVVALVEWVRGWNLAHERKVKFYGFDMQASPASGMHLLTYLERVAPHLAAACQQNIAPLASAYVADDLRLMPAIVREQASSQLATVLDAFTTQRADWISRTSETEWHLARQSAVVLDQFAQINAIENESLSWTKSWRFRDRCMAANVRALLDAQGPGAKAVLWAHNGHVQRTPSVFFKVIEFTNMGSHLHAMFGKEMVVVGFAFNLGSFQAKDETGKLRDHTVPPAPEGFIEAALAATGFPLLALDLANTPPDGPVATWLAGKPLQRSIGAVFYGDHSNYSEAANPRDKYDILVFVDRTTAARANPKVSYPEPGIGSHDEPTNLALAGSSARPDGWRALTFSRHPYTVMAAEEETPQAGRAVCLAHGDDTLSNDTLSWGDGVLTQTFPVGSWHRQRLVFSAAMRAEAPQIGTGAQLVVRFLSKSGTAVEVVQSGAPVRSSHWIRHAIAADVPGKAEQIEICLVTTGAAAVWFGDLDLELKAAAGAVAVSDAEERRTKRRRPPRPWDVPPPSLPIARQLRAGAAPSVTS